MRKKLPLFGIRIRLLRIPQFVPLRLAVTHYIYNREFSSISQCAASAIAARCVSLCSTLRRSSQRTGFSASVVLCFFWQQSPFVLAAFFIYVSCLMKSPYQGCVWPYKAF